MKMKLKEWQRPMLCSHCMTLFWSDYSGEYVTCECGDCFCDQTPYYMRCGGKNLMSVRSAYEEDDFDA